MLDHADASAPDAPAPGACAELAHSRRLAVDTLQTLLQLGLPPSPRNYELWFTHLSGANAELSRRLTELREMRVAVTADVLDTLYDSHVRLADPDAQAVGATACELEQHAREMLEHLAEGQGPLQEFGASLAGWPDRIRQARSLSALDVAVAALGVQTARMVDDNRRLQDRLDRSARRVDRLRRSLAALRTSASVDPLTGLLTRKALDARLRRALAGPEHEPVTILLADIDHFKRFNDEHGHSTGDLVLRLVARLLTSHVKGRDAVGRYGGEEFMIVMAGADLAGGESVARQICAAISAKPLVTGRASGGPVGPVTLSVGVARRRPGERQAALVERADAALYEAKAAGRNRAVAAAG